MTIRFQEKRLSESVVEFTAFRDIEKSSTVGAFFAVAMLSLVMYYTIPSLLWLAVTASILLILLFGAANAVTEESILIARDFGVQYHRKYISGTVETNFLDRDKIRFVILHEYIKYSGVYFCLAFVVESSDKLAVCFTHVYPGLDCLRKVYENCILPDQHLQKAGANSSNSRYHQRDTLSSN